MRSSIRAAGGRDETLRPGARLGRFVVAGEIARGAMGVVYHAHQPALGRAVALKVRVRSSSDPDGAARFVREGRAAARIDHPNVVRVFDAGESDGRAWISMELVRGRTLARELAESGPLSPERVLEVAIACCRGLGAAAGASIVHRDVKPANVLLGDDGAIKLADLGLARGTSRDPALTLLGDFLGTPAYIAPEQAHDPRAADLRSDLWSLGATLYHALHGTPPWLEPSGVATVLAARTRPLVFPADASRGARALEPVLRRLLAKDPAARFPDARAARLAFEEIRARLAATPPRPRRRPRARLEAPRIRAPRAATALVLLVAAVLAGGALGALSRQVAGARSPAADASPGDIP